MYGGKAQPLFYDISSVVTLTNKTQQSALYLLLYMDMDIYSAIERLLPRDHYR